MKKKILCALLLIILTTLTVACNGATKQSGAARLENIKVRFDMKKPSDLIFSLDLESGESLICLEGENIADGDYYLYGDQLCIRRDFWVNLDSGEHTIKVVTSLGDREINFDLNAQHKQNTIVNGGFETGDLFGWTVETVFKGDENILSYTDDGVKENDTFSSLEIPYGGVGRYVYGIDDVNEKDWCQKVGVIRSSVFTLGGCGYITFMLGGGRNGETCYLSVRDADTDEELARYKNEKFFLSSYVLNKNDYYGYNLVKYKADLSEYIGKNIFLEFCDYGTAEWDALTIDEIVTYYDTEPDTGALANNIKPVFSGGYVMNNLYNGDFSLGLTGYTQSGADRSDAEIFLVEDGVLKSSAQGDRGRGVLRSSPFRLDGSGVISMNLGAAQGENYEKDTFVSVRECGTNREVFRFANRNHDGTAMIKYYVDLSAHIGKNLYLEFTDNATEAYDVIFVSDIVTYYKDAPEYDFSDAAINIAY